jgi:hypothetical protein
MVNMLRGLELGEDQYQDEYEGLCMDTLISNFDIRFGGRHGWLLH